MVAIKNKEEVIVKLAELLMQFDKEENTYQTDVYLYLNEDGNGRLDTFVNVGGNSWLNDSHYTIYTDKEHYDSNFETYYQNVGDIAEFLELSAEQLMFEVKQYHQYDDEDIADKNIEPEWYEVWQYIKNNEEYYKMLEAEYDSYIDSEAAEYENSAREIFDQWYGRQLELESEQ